MVEIITPSTRRRQEYYADFRKDFLLNPVSNDISRKTDEEAVKESIKNLILTDRGERLFQHEVGCGIRQQLFNNFTPQVRLAIENAIIDTVNSYEPRCNLISVEVAGNPDLNVLYVTIVFNIINIPNEIVLTLTLDRAR
jgi:phage baseplate assembly protein W